jgi:hypothetical protein
MRPNVTEKPIFVAKNTSKYRLKVVVIAVKTATRRCIKGVFTPLNAYKRRNF